MEVLDIAAAVVLAVCLILLTFVVRRSVLRTRGASVDMAVRGVGHPRGWGLGLVRFDRDRLEWFQLFSLSPRPHEVFPRAGLVVIERRRPATSEQLALMTNAAVLRCTTSVGPVEFAMQESVVTGFLAWLEAAPPGATLPRMAE